MYTRMEAQVILRTIISYVNGASSSDVTGWSDLGHSQERASGATPTPGSCPPKHACFPYADSRLVPASPLIFTMTWGELGRAGRRQITLERPHENARHILGSINA